MRHDDLKRLLCGIVIGAAGIAPGVSGGVAAVSLDMYAPSIAALSSLKRDTRRSVRFLLPLALGVGLGIITTGFALMRLMERFAVEMVYLFAGLVLGSLPGLMRKSGQWRAANILPLVLGAACCYALNCALPGMQEAERLNALQALLCGAILAFGTVIPGISSSFLLMRAGLYRAYLAALSGMRLAEAALIALGFAAIAAVTIKLVDCLLRRHSALSYLVISGFTIISVIAALPPLNSAVSPTAGVLLMALGAGAALMTRSCNEDCAPA